MAITISSETAIPVTFIFNPPQIRFDLRSSIVSGLELLPQIAESLDSQRNDGAITCYCKSANQNSHELISFAWSN